MKTYEFHYGAKDGAHWLDRILNSDAFLVDQDRITSHGEAKGFLFDGHAVDDWTKTPDSSLFWNGRRYRCTICVDGKARGWFRSFRWAGKNPDAREFLQMGFGFKGNGRYTVTFRIQSDNTGAAGVRGPNLGQATGFNWGPK